MKRKLCTLLTLMTVLSTMLVGAGADLVRESGTCGADMMWQVFYIEEGADAMYLRLELTGSGDMWNYGPLDDCVAMETPWKKYAGSMISVSMPEKITAIGDYAFYWCQTWNKELTIPGSVTRIGRAAFSNCRYLKGELVLPEGLTVLGESAFLNCWNLTADQLIIPEGVTEIPEDAFSGCYRLKGAVYIPAGVTAIGRDAFDRTAFTDVYFFGDAPTLASGAFPEGIVVHYPVDADGWTDGTETGTWNGYAAQSWAPNGPVLEAEQELSSGTARVKVNNYRTGELSGQLWCAAYDANGRMLGVGMERIEVDAMQSAEFALPLSCRSGKAAQVKAFLLAEDCAPLTDCS